MSNTPAYWDEFPGYPTPRNSSSTLFSSPSTEPFPQYTIANSPPRVPFASPPPGTYPTAQNSDASSPLYQVFPVSPASTPAASRSASYSTPFSPMQAPYATRNSVANLQNTYPGPYSGQYPITEPAPIVGYPDVIQDPSQYPFPNTPVSVPAEYSPTNTTFQNTENWEWLRPQNLVDGQNAHIIGKGRDGVVWRVNSQSLAF